MRVARYQRRADGGEHGDWGVGEIRLGQGVMRYREVGEGPILLFVHGILANGTLWREVVPRLSGKFRCGVPDLPVDGHAAPMDQGAWRSSSLASWESG